MKTITLFRKLIWIFILSGFYCQAYAQEPEIILSESFDKANGNGWANNSNYPSITSFDDCTSTSGWSGDKCYEGVQCIKLGASSKPGSLTTPEIDLSDNNATYTLTFNACAWSKDKTSINIIIDNQEAIEVSGLTNGGDHEKELYEKTFTVELKNGTATSKITFQSIQDSKARFFLDNIVITKTSGSGVELEDPKCTFSAESATYTLGEAFSAPNFTTVSDGEITYKSSNPEIATVDNSGNITAIAAGTTTITASVATTDIYAAGSASYTLTVVDPSILFTESFANGLNGFTSTGELWGTGTFNGTSYAVINAYNKGAQTEMLASPSIDLSEVANATLTFDQAIGYIGNNDPKVDFTLWIKEENSEDWTQLIIPNYPEASGGWSKFVSSGEIALQAYCGKKIQIGFQYKSTEEKQSGWEVTNILIKKAEPTTFTISVSDAGYATYFTNQAWVVADNMKAGIVTGVENKNLTIDWKCAAGSVVPANTAVLIQADAKEYVCEVSNSEEEAPANNLLKGSTTAATTEGVNCLFYKLSYDNDGKNLGFYWAAENGAAFTNEANKAYLALTTTVAQNVRGFGLEGDGTTGIGQIVNGETLVNVYTIDGIIVRKQVKESQALNGLKKGIYIVNGKKVIK